MCVEELWERMKKVLIWVGVFVVIILANVGLRSSAIGSLREPVLSQLVDPSSAQFRNERYYVDSGNKTSILCGEVNSKNRMGGYGGFVPFYTSGTTALIGDGPTGDNMVKVFCANPQGTSRWWVIRF